MAIRGSNIYLRKPNLEPICPLIDGAEEKICEFVCGERLKAFIPSASVYCRFQKQRMYIYFDYLFL